MLPVGLEIIRFVQVGADPGVALRMILIAALTAAFAAASTNAGPVSPGACAGRFGAPSRAARAPRNAGAVSLLTLEPSPGSALPQGESEEYYLRGPNTDH